MSSTTTIDFSKVNNIYANGTKLTDLWYKTKDDKTGVISISNLLWDWNNAGTITVTLEFMSMLCGLNEPVVKTWEVPAGYTWQNVISKNLISGTISNTYSQGFSYKLEKISNNEQAEIIIFLGQQSYWLASEEKEMVQASDKLIKEMNYFLVIRSREDGDVIKRTHLKLGDNKIVINADEPNFYFFAKEAGTYMFTASSDNAFIGYEKKLVGSDGEDYYEANWVEGTSFELEAEEGEVLYIACSNQDFSNETYILNISKKE